MKNLLTKLRYVPKRFAVAAALVVATATAALTFAWGPNRATFTIENPAPYITFNSITNNPNIGDERNFVGIRENGTTGLWQDDQTVVPGKEYVVRMYVHNNAAANLNLVAENVTAKFNLPTTTGKSIQVNGFLNSTNANPVEVYDHATFNSTQDFNLAVVPGSIKYYNNANGSGFTIPESIFTSNGAKLGYTQMDGNIPGCFQYAGYLTFVVKPQFAPTANFTVSKQVRKAGVTGWNETVTVNPGDQVEYLITYDNISDVQQNNVVLKDTLPAGTTLVNGTTYVANGTNPSGVKVGDGIASGDGINIGNYAGHSVAYVKFTAQVATNDTLPACGLNALKNIAKITTDYGWKEDSADVTVTKTCLPQPAADCKAITPHLISRTQFSFDGEATVANGATVSKYTFVVKNSAGAVVKTVTVDSTALKVNSGTITLDTVGVYTVMLTVTTSLGDKSNVNCQTTVEVKSEPVVPTYTCDLLTVNTIERTKFNFVTTYTVKNATLVRIDYVVRNAAGTELYRGTDSTYTQTTVGNYTVEAIVVVKVDGVEKTATSTNCKKPFEVKPEDKDIQVCRLSDKTIVTIKESAFDASKYSKNLDDCKVPATIQVCELTTGNIINIKETDFDATKHSKNLDDCKPIKVCELATYTVIEIKQKDFDSAKHSKDLAACEKIQVCELSSDTVITIRKTEFDAAKHSKTLSDCDKIKVCVIATGEVKTIKRAEFDSKTQSTNMNDCKDINVCRLSDKTVVTIKQSAFDSAKYSYDTANCKPATPPVTTTPPVLPSTGPEMIVGSLLGSSALGLGVSSFVRSRSALRRAHRGN
ncbi:MAG: hypothetical protein WBB39_03490 [Candidatus Saccharimonadales bacterium]